MKTTTHFWNNLHSFFVVGINYRLSDVHFRSSYSLQEDQCAAIYQKLKDRGIEEAFILSTCNRTEFYCYKGSLDETLEIWSKEVGGNTDAIKKHIYYKQGEDAVKHLFKVGSGLDSQILGDYEISGQIKKSYAFAKKENALGSFCDRLINTMQQVAKKIRTETEITMGSVSVSHFAVNYINDHLVQFPKANILLLGMGKIGINTLKGLNKNIPSNQICIINRTDSKALELSQLFDIKCRPYELLDESVNIADIIIVATNAPSPIVNQSQFLDHKERLIIDLSIPNNVEDEVKAYPQNTFLNVDELSKYTDETLNKRWQEVPAALHIVDEGMEQFILWLKERSGYIKVEYIKNSVINLNRTNTSPLYDQQFIISKCNDFFVKEVKQQNMHGCRCIQLVNELLEYSTAR